MYTFSYLCNLYKLTLYRLVYVNPVKFGEKIGQMNAVQTLVLGAFKNAIGAF